MKQVATEAWRAELERVVRPMLDHLLGREGLSLTAAEFDFIARFEPQPSDGDPLTWLAEVEDRARGMARTRPAPVARETGGGHQVGDTDAVDDPRWEAFAQILAIELLEDPFVGNWRAYHLPPTGLLSRKAAPAFRDQLEPEARRWLDQIAASLVDRHGWWDADEAALSILTGAAPHGFKTRTHITVRERVATSRVVIEADPRASPQAVANSYRRARSAETLDQLDLPEAVARHHKLDGSRPHPISAKQAALAVHLARHRDGSWQTRRVTWNKKVKKENPDWTYGDDTPFARDAGRAWEHVVGETFTHKRPRIHDF